MFATLLAEMRFYILFTDDADENQRQLVHMFSADIDQTAAAALSVYAEI